MAGAARPSLRERKKSETRQAIHEAALRLVAENGIAHASVDAICSEAGVSSRTFFNYFPSKVAAIVGLSSFRVTDAGRAAFLTGTGETGLVRDLCILVSDIMNQTVREGADREAVRDLLAARPELAADVIRFAGELRKEVVALAALRTTPERAGLAVALVMGAVDCALHSPQQVEIGDGPEQFTEWLLAAVDAMRGLARESLD
ncbi:TetR/AcrR family transcriptional regulator [Herbiconiux moechotypicola]|uniref:TetR family transcriptional regulator n=1 Tax=Herbiconiux moechotypicola TaxID=637393 RepID=A0ABN3E6Q0_9MICO|nr:TetR/AcrR family transcriptional regulator [Herbiconiux moechotypicola]MCS5731871.1 TetR/AcrR family transcriptional regulator [Herbiconiux moechotypicola]